MYSVAVADNITSETDASFARRDARITRLAGGPLSVFPRLICTACVSLPWTRQLSLPRHIKIQSAS